MEGGSFCCILPKDVAANPLCTRAELPITKHIYEHQQRHLQSPQHHTLRMCHQRSTSNSNPPYTIVARHVVGAAPPSGNQPTQHPSCQHDLCPIGALPQPGSSRQQWVPMLMLLQCCTLAAHPLQAACHLIHGQLGSYTPHHLPSQHLLTVLAQVHV